MVESLKSVKEKGFTLLEVMIAITLFAFFITAFLTAQGFNVSDSALSEEQIRLQTLCEKKINDLYLNPPKFSNATKDSKETMQFEEKEYSGYEYTLELKPLLIPDFAQLFAQKDGASEEAQEANDSTYFNDSAQGNRNSSIEKMVFEELKKNIEKIIWQARVTVTNKETKYNYTLTTLLTNTNERIQLNIGF